MLYNSGFFVVAEVMHHSRKIEYFPFNNHNMPKLFATKDIIHVIFRKEKVCVIIKKINFATKVVRKVTEDKLVLPSLFVGKIYTIIAVVNFRTYIYTIYVFSSYQNVYTALKMCYITSYFGKHFKMFEHILRIWEQDLK